MVCARVFIGRERNAVTDLYSLIPARPGSPHSPATMIAVATHYAVCGNVRETAAASGVPDRTVADWINQAWWVSLVAEIRLRKQDELDAALSGLIHSAVEAARTRIAQGDCRLVKRKNADGEDVHELVNVPVSARDAAVVAAIAADKRQIVRGEATEIVRHDSSKLDELRNQMRTISGRTIDGTCTPSASGDVG